jgi:hypothetical protein
MRAMYGLGVICVLLAPSAVARAGPVDHCAPGALLKPTPSGAHVRVGVGTTLLLKAPCAISKIAVSVAPWDARVVSENLVELRGLAEGQGKLLAWCSNGSRLTYPIEVTRAEAPESTGSGPLRAVTTARWRER